MAKSAGSENRRQNKEPTMKIKTKVKAGYVDNWRVQR
jgi:hypothetical protein